MPYTINIHDSTKYKETRRELNKWSNGIDVSWGILDNDELEVQALRFSDEFSPEQVREWTLKNNYTVDKIPDRVPNNSQEVIMFDKMGEILVDVEQFDYMPISIKGSTEITDEGFLKCIAPVARLGVYKYVLPDGTIRRDLVDEDTLFSTDSMKSLELKPFTNEHPMDLLDPVNVKRHSVGSTGEKVYRDEGHLMSSFTIHDKQAIEDVKAGKRQLSPGYRGILVYEPGIYNGDAYDFKQRRRVYNHVALCNKARGGDALSINIDSIDGISNVNISQTKGDISMPKIKINGIDYEAAQEVINHVDSITSKLQKVEQTTAAAVANVDTVQKSLTETQAQYDALKAQIPQLVKDSVKDRVRLEKLASVVLDKDGIAQIDSLDNEALQEKIVNTKYPTIELKGKDSVYVKALVDSIEVLPNVSNSLMDQLDITHRKPNGKQVFTDSEKAREAYVESLKDSYKKNPYEVSRK